MFGGVGHGVGASRWWRNAGLRRVWGRRWHRCIKVDALVGLRSTHTRCLQWCGRRQQPQTCLASRAGAVPRAPPKGRHPRAGPEPFALSRRLLAWLRKQCTCTPHPPTRCSPAARHPRRSPRAVRRPSPPPARPLARLQPAAPPHGCASRAARPPLQLRACCPPRRASRAAPPLRPLPCKVRVCGAPPAALHPPTRPHLPPWRPPSRRPVHPPHAAPTQTSTRPPAGRRCLHLCCPCRAPRPSHSARRARARRRAELND